MIRIEKSLNFKGSEFSGSEVWVFGVWVFVTPIKKHRSVHFTILRHTVLSLKITNTFLFLTSFSWRWCVAFGSTTNGRRSVELCFWQYDRWRGSLLGIIYFINKGTRTFCELNYILFTEFYAEILSSQSGPASSLSNVNEDNVSIKVSSLFRGETDIVQHWTNLYICHQTIIRQVFSLQNIHIILIWKTP